jgi:hypothetical protein
MRIDYHHIRWILPAFFITYVVIAGALLRLLNTQLPPSIDIIIQLIIAPMFFIFRPFYPLLNRLGLMEGEWWRLPSLGGMVLSCVVYAAFLYIVGVLITFVIKHLRVHFM